MHVAAVGAEIPSPNKLLLNAITHVACVITKLFQIVQTVLDDSEMYHVICQCKLNSRLQTLSAIEDYLQSTPTTDV